MEQQYPVYIVYSGAPTMGAPHDRKQLESRDLEMEETSPAFRVSIVDDFSVQNVILCKPEMNDDTNASFDVSLISLVKNHPILWDSKRTDYRDNKDKRDATWNEIGVLLDRPADHCRLRWKALRERYGRELKKRDETGESDDKWPHMQSMHFIFDHIKPRLKARKSKEGYVLRDTPTPTTTTEKQQMTTTPIRSSCVTVTNDVRPTSSTITPYLRRFDNLCGLMADRYRALHPSLQDEFDIEVLTMLRRFTKKNSSFPE